MPDDILQRISHLYMNDKMWLHESFEIQNYALHCYIKGSRNFFNVTAVPGLLLLVEQNCIRGMILDRTIIYEQICLNQVHACPGHYHLQENWIVQFKKSRSKLVNDNMEMCNPMCPVGPREQNISLLPRSLGRKSVLSAKIWMKGIFIDCFPLALSSMGLKANGRVHISI